MNSLNIKLNSLLEKQINKYCSNIDLSSKEIRQLFISISNAYDTYENDKLLSDHAYNLSEQEYVKINEQLKKENEIKKLSIEKLNESLNTLLDNHNLEVHKNDELLDIVSFIETKIIENKEIEKELILAKILAENANNAKTEFLSTMSHEIRTPLNAVIGMSYLLLEKNKDERLNSNLNILKYSAENLLVLINDILDYNKIESGKLELECSEFDLHHLIVKIKNANQIIASDKGNKIKFYYDDDLPKVFIGDQMRIGQILNNLLSNANKFTHNGLIAIEINLKETIKNHAIISFQIKDTGIGIAQENQIKIFEEFTQASSNTSFKYGGTGLGLSIVRKLLHLQGSEIFLSSEIDKGSNFYFDLTLPIVINNNTSKIFIEDPKHTLENVSILLVEDTPFNIEFALEFLKSRGSSVDVALNGQEALEKFTDNIYDIILMDIQMPIMDGYTCAQEIRKFNLNIPIIALTASSTNEILKNAKEKGMNDIVSKPFMPNDLINKINKYITKKNY
jgi:signal transduction histidine kinase/CheY-like chemotaxis protein